MNVVIGYLHRADATTPLFQRQLRMLCVRDAYLYPGRIAGVVDHESSANIAHARNQVVRKFLAERGDWLWMVDDDMTFSEGILDVLLSTADPQARPIIGGLCFGMRPPLRPDGGFDHDPELGYLPDLFPTLYVRTGNVVRNVTDYERNALVPVDSTGAACLLVHRSVFEDDRWQHDHPLPWFRESSLAGSIVSEDQFFALTATGMGYPIHVHTGARTGHVKPLVCTERVADMLRVFADPAPPADERVAVVVPVYRRSGRAAPLVASVVASTGLASVYAVVDPAEDPAIRDEWVDAGATVLDCDRSGFAAKVNHAFTHTTEPYVAVVGDDVQFRAGWWNEALDVARRTGAGLVATNDLGNPAVMAGRHATHPVFRRSYVDEHGGSWTPPGVVASEEYRHCFVDNEWSTVAIDRGEFAYAPGAIIEHFHPVWGKGADDDTYRHGQQSLKLDEETFRRRLRKHHKVASW